MKLVLSEISSKGYRNRFEIVKDILSVLDFAGIRGSKKTHIMYGANLSYKLLERYIREVLESGLVYSERGIFFISDKGKEFLKIYVNYENERKEINKHFMNINNGKNELEKMLE